MSSDPYGRTGCRRVAPSSARVRLHFRPHKPQASGARLRPRHDARGYPMPDERLEVSVTFDERGYIGNAPELRQAVVALSLGGLRRKIEIAMLPDEVRVVLQFDGLAERERHRRRGRRSYC